MSETKPQCKRRNAASFAQQGQLGEAREVRATLDKAVAAVKTDQAVALEMFNKGEGASRTVMTQGGHHPNLP
jgi:hypothetical protein